MAERERGEQQLPPPGRHGGDGAALANALGMNPDEVIDLSASMNPFAPDVTALLNANHAELRRSISAYPDSTRATAALGTAIGIDPDRLVLTNGGAEAIALVAAQLKVGAVVEPEFSLYRRHLTTVDPAAGRWRSDPANPLGTLAAPTDTAEVWDEAFYPLATGRWTGGDERLWRLGSLTKLWNCPGLRLGYVIAPTTEQARLITQRQPQWAVNALALTTIERLAHDSDLVGWNRSLVSLRTRFAKGLAELGYEVEQTQANWLLVRWPQLRGALAPLGIAVRDCSSFGMAGVFRVAVPRPGQLDRVLSACASVAAQ